MGYKSDVTIHAGKDLSSLPPLMQLLHVPTDPSVRAEVSKQIGDGLVLRFEELLSAEEHEIVRRLPPLGGTSAPDNWIELTQYREMLDRFDDFILTEIRVFGWRLLMSDRVLGRIAAWSQVDPKGRRWLKRLGEELGLYVGVQLGETKFPITNPGLYLHREKVVKELESLLRISKTHFSQKNGWPSPSDLISWMQTKITSERDSFPTLALELPNLLNFMGDVLHNKKVGSARLLQGDMEGAELCNLWFGARLNRSPEAARQEISKLGRFFKR